MSAETYAYVMEHSLSKGADLLVLSIIANDVNHQGKGSFLSYTVLAKRSRMSHRSVRRIVSRLEGKNELVCETRGDGKTPSLWVIPMPLRGVNLTSQGGQSDLPRGVNLTSQGGQSDLPLSPPLRTPPPTTI